MAIYLERLRQLNIVPDSMESSPAYVSAASGLLRIYENFYVIDDDSLSLACFPDAADEGGQRFRLLDGVLSPHPLERKKSKPDLESICSIEPEMFPPFGAILAVPSGSKANRMTGALAVFSQPGILGQKVLPIDFAPLFQELRTRFTDLNIEGCFVADGQLLMLQRGNGPTQQNAVIRLNLEKTVQAIKNQQSLEPGLLLSVSEMALGTLRGVNLSFTDGASIQATEIWFLAVAEDVRSTYEDGRYCGAVLGCFNQKNEIIFQEELLCPEKPEGICLVNVGDRPMFLVVTDADDPLKPSFMYRGKRGIQTKS